MTIKAKKSVKSQVRADRGVGRRNDPPCFSLKVVKKSRYNKGGAKRKKNTVKHKKSKIKNTIKKRNFKKKHKTQYIYKGE